MHYIGSKEKLLPFLTKEIFKHIDEPLHVRNFCDLFAGTGIVGRCFADEGLHVMSNDIEYYSYIINHAYLLTRSLHEYDNQLHELNALMPREGLIFNYYAMGGGEERRYFSDENAKKIDAMRQEIELWYCSGVIDKERYYLLLATLLESVTYISNTASIYSAFLKTLKKTAQMPLILKALHVKENSASHKVYHSDANKIIQEISGDILYLDPPYNLRQYGANYHILNTIAKYQSFEPRGKTGLPKYYSSPFSRQKSAYESLENLLKNAQFDTIFLSYSSDGIISRQEIEKLMQSLGEYHYVSQEHKRFNAKHTKDTHHKTMEYLHVLKKNL
ncbi:MAG: DNA adenine methylase [Campylobacterota bacterium]|nr:DNA adenine methylase [Campylobacterota bacterium]